jgi:diguanylate cyclase (GGDEF)-like protein/PAS domain S-box-containing protein
MMVVHLPTSPAEQSRRHCQSESVPSANTNTPRSQTTPSASAEAAPSSQADDVFELDLKEHLDAATLEKIRASLLGRYPQAPVLAFDTGGLAIPIPESLPLEENRVLAARSGLELVIHRDRATLLEMWDRVLAKGTARCVAHLVNDPENTVAFYGVDLREEHGVVLGVLAPSGASGSSSPKVGPAPKHSPRFATMHKDEGSFILKVDHAVTEILGWRADEMEGHRAIEFMHPDDHPLAIDNWMEMLESPGPARRVRVRHRRNDGSWVWFEVTNHNLLEDPEHACVVSEIVDISEEMAAHEELRAREELLDRLAEAIPMGLFQVDAGGEIVYTNDRLHEILGVARAETLQDQMATVVEADQEALVCAVEDVLTQGLPADVEVELRLPSSQELRFCSISLRALTHEDGTISGAIACLADVTDSTRMRDELKRRATFDELTGCHNRASFMRALEANIAGAQPDVERAVMFIDLDRFKELNDRFGHAAGDELLRILGERLRDTVRSDDLVGRVGGDEFLVMCPDVGGPDGAMRLAARLAKTLHQSITLTVGSISPQVSIGVAWSNCDGIDADSLVAQADVAMYQSKRQRRGEPKLARTMVDLTARRAAAHASPRSRRRQLQP